jgi:hypothetical protein
MRNILDVTFSLKRAEWGHDSDFLSYNSIGSGGREGCIIWALRVGVGG